ncbi:MAG: ribosome maturation factor RimM, partial [Candidatus Kryptoniota bacterium]
ATSPDIEQYEVEDAQSLKDYVVLKLKDINSFEDGEKLLGAKIFVRDEERVRLQEGYYYLDSLIGMDVFCNDKKCRALKNLGTVAAVEGSPIQYRLVIQRSDGSEFQLPFVKEFIKEVSLAERKIEVNIIEGILDGGVDED